MSADEIPSRPELDELLDRLGFEAGDFIAVCHKLPSDPDSFASDVVAIEDVASTVARFVETHDVWLSAQPVAGPARSRAGRGKREDVTALVELYADLDVGPGKLPSLVAALDVTDALSSMLGATPAALVFSGHGVQPRWAIEREELVEEADRKLAGELLDRFGELVKAVARRHGGEADEVFDLPRILRAPSTVNRKSEPIAVRTELPAAWSPLSVEELAERLDELVAALPAQEPAADAREARTGLGGGTGSRLGELVAAGAIPWPAILATGDEREEWKLVGKADRDGRRRILRPTIAGSKPSSPDSGNVLGAVLVIHSGAAGGWWKAGEAIGAAEAFAMSHGMSYVDAMLAIEEAGRKLAAGMELDEDDPCRRIPAGALTALHEAREADLGDPLSPAYAGPVTLLDSAPAATTPAAGELDAVEEPEPRKLYADLSFLVTGEAPAAPEPTIGIRDDGIAVIYPGAVNTLFGDPECGKTWIALAFAAERLNAGGFVAYIDADHNGATAIAGRLLSFGVGLLVVADPQRFRCYEPESAEELIAIRDELLGLDPDLVVVDSVGEVIPLFGGNSNDNDDITKANRRLNVPLKLAGWSVIQLDHLSKNGDGSWPTGGIAKKRATDGVMLHVKTKEAFAPGAVGEAWLNIAKDRHGAVREAHPTSAGIFELDSSGSYTEWRIISPAGAASSEPSELMGKIATFLAARHAAGDERVGVREIRKAIKAKTTAHARAMKALRAGGYVDSDKAGSWLVKAFEPDVFG